MTEYDEERDYWETGEIEMTHEVKSHRLPKEPFPWKTILNVVVYTWAAFTALVFIIGMAAG